MAPKNRKGVANDAGAAGPDLAGSVDGSREIDLNAGAVGACEGDGQGGTTTTNASLHDCRDTLTFDDPNLERIVRTAIGVPSGPLSAASVRALNGLDVYDVKTLAGIECLTALITTQLWDDGVLSYPTPCQ